MISHLTKKLLFRDKKNLKDKISGNYAKITVIPKNPEKKVSIREFTEFRD